MRKARKRQSVKSFDTSVMWMRLPADMRQDIGLLAKDDFRKLGDQVRYMLRQQLKLEESRLELLRSKSKRSG